MRKRAQIMSLLMVFAALMSAVSAKAQICGGNSTPSEPWDCDTNYQWPRGVITPCPNVVIKQKSNHYADDNRRGDHLTQLRYRREGWDTVVDCNTTELVLSCTPYIPVKNFNGCYTVDEIPYDPIDPTFHAGNHLNISTDDAWDQDIITFPFPFMFFGKQYSHARVASNGLVSFNTSYSGYCTYDYQANAPIPNSNFVYKNSIYGVYEDIDPRYLQNEATGGMFRSIGGTKPCRYLCASVNGVDLFGNHGNYNTYQIVCYEGTNIIEVHVKDRNCCSTTNSGNGILGIQNETGNAQQPSSSSSASNYYVQSGAPAAFWPTGWNNTHKVEHNVAYRFTPQGDTPKNYGWYRILDDGTSVPLSVMPQDFEQDYTPEAAAAAASDTNGYYYRMPMSDMDLNYYTCPNVTLAHVAPHRTSRYYFQLDFIGGSGSDTTEYHLRDTITIGYDHNNHTEFVPSQRDICYGASTTTPLRIKMVQDTLRTVWSVSRRLNGATVPLPLSILNRGGWTEGTDYKDMMVSFNSQDLPMDGMPANKIDSIYIHVDAFYTNGCDSNANALIRVFPNFDTTIVEGRCQGEVYHFSANGRDYRESVQESVTLHSQPGCDSVVNLNLTVDSVSLTIDPISDCKPIVWQNGRTYSRTNTETALTDTVVYVNRFGCDSVVRLNLTIMPLTARFTSSLEFFDFDHLDAIFTDISIGGDSNVWKFPAPTLDQHGPTAYYSIPIEANDAIIKLVEYSQYGCVDSTTLRIPFNKEHFWIPNAFTPDNPSGNALFGSVSSETIQQEMLIYNRRGEMVFRCEGVDCKWDGRDLNGEPCMQGAYVYIIRYTNTFAPTETKIRKGTVTLIR